ncbi:MAG: ABC transporter permease [Candidatus Bipolaricaulaceae bacterium]
MRTIKKLILNPLSALGLVLVLFFAAIAIAAPWLAPPWQPDEPYRIPRHGFRAEPRPPNFEAWKTFPPPWQKRPLGTSEGQYDIYYGIIWGTRTAFKVGLIITGSSVLLGLVLGALAAYCGGWVDEILMRVTEVFMAFPFLIAAIALTSALGRGINNVMIALIVFSWPSYARLIRGDILAIKEREYVISARALGASHLRIVCRHILPNAIYPTLVVASMDIGSMVLSFSALSFLGLGAEVGYADWGQMISFAREWMLGAVGGNPLQYWYVVVFPGMAILLFVLGWNLIGDAFRDLLDPRLRRIRM